MPSKYEGYENRLRRFNEKYHVKFSFEKYNSQSLKNKNLAHPLKNANDISKENLKYQNAFLGIYKECIENSMIKFSCAPIDPINFAKEFEALMGDYRSYCEEHGKSAPDVNGGWKSNVEAMEAMKATLANDMSVSKIEQIKNNYLSGKLSFNDIKNDIGVITSKGLNAVTVEEVSVIHVYKEAFESIVENRSIWQKINPFRWPTNSRENKVLSDLEILFQYVMQHSDGADVVASQEYISQANADIDRSIAVLNVVAEREKSNERNSAREEPKNHVNFGNEFEEKVNDISAKIELKDAAVKDHSIEP